MIEQLIKDGFEPIIDNENYLINRYGVIYSIDKNKFINRPMGGEYVVVRVNKKSHRLHVLVARQFIENPLNKPLVNHIDANKKNNYVENLEWATHSENVSHWHKHYKENFHIYERDLPVNTMRYINKHFLKMGHTKLAEMFGIRPSHLWTIEKYFRYYTNKKHPCIPCDNEVKFLS